MNGVAVATVKLTIPSVEYPENTEQINELIADLDVTYEPAGGDEIEFAGAYDDLLLLVYRFTDDIDEVRRIVEDDLVGE